MKIMAHSKTFFYTICLLSVSFFQQTAFSQGEEVRRSNTTSSRYEINQKFDGVSYQKDNNVWIYNKRFADEFGMPKEGVRDIKNYEAAAFRVEEQNYRLHGITGIDERYLVVNQCTLDVYFDENKNPLPWSTNEQADWSGHYNSTRWLRDKAGRRSGRHGDVPAYVLANKVLGGLVLLHPFFDPETKREAFWLSNASVDRNPSGDYFNFNAVPILGYKRNFIGGFSVISLDVWCAPISRSDILFRLEVRDEIISPTVKRLYEFYVPTDFTSKINLAVLAKKEKDAEHYKKMYAHLLDDKDQIKKSEK